MDYTVKLKSYIQAEREILDSMNIDAINEVMNVLEKAREQGVTVYICGNGGSAATASHFVCDFNNGISIHRKKKYNFVCLNDNVSVMTAISNDIGYDRVYEIQLENRINKDDLLIVISGSGNSKNVVNAVKLAKKIGVKVIGLTGYDGGEVKKLADYNLHVPVDNMQMTEDVHMIMDHLMMWVLSGIEE